MTQMIGLGYYDTVTPGVILRNVLESPAWYTAYTPYQPEISQGRLEALLNFQTMVGDLTGLPVANASMLDESTAAAEAMTLVRRAGKSKSNKFVIDADTLPQTLAVIETRAEPLGIEIVVADLSQGIEGLGLGGDFYGVLLSYPGASGVVRDQATLIEEIHAAGAQAVVVADLLSLTLLRPPGEIGADVVVGTTQRFGVPIGFGGPHAGYMAVRSGLERQLPGRLVGVSVDADGSLAYRLALQTREQHIRREKATSQHLHRAGAARGDRLHVRRLPRSGRACVPSRPACTAWPRCSRPACARPGSTSCTASSSTPSRCASPARPRPSSRRRARRTSTCASWTTTPSRSRATRRPPARMSSPCGKPFGVTGSDVDAIDADTADGIPADLRRTSDYLTHPVFHAHRSETALLRYLRALSDKDVALDRSMIPLGSCTMKLNATAEMESITWPEFSTLHPFAPVEDAAGLLKIVSDLEAWLAEVTGYDAVSLQPNAGSQGEFAGLLAIRAYHRAHGEDARDVCLIPSVRARHQRRVALSWPACASSSFAATTRATSTWATCATPSTTHADDLAAIMITYPSTHGVYEDTVREVCGLVHDAGGQVYVDGANLNALIGLARYGKFGSDVSHLNLHKTFCIPHGGGGPGVGPIGVRSHLAPFLPNHPLQPTAGPATGVGPISAAPWGSASILPISWAYVRMMGGDGLRRATLTAVAAANYVARRLDEHYPVLYTGEGGFVAHECILDLRPITKATGVTVDDVAKRLADYGLHAPDDVVPGRRHADGRADRVRGPGARSTGSSTP